MLLDDSQKMFVLIRDDLYSKSYKAVQGGHAVAQFFLDHNIDDIDWDNGYMIYLKVKDEEQLEKWMWKLGKKKNMWSAFREPDLDNELTALACICDGKIFKKLKLL